MFNADSFTIISENKVYAKTVKVRKNWHTFNPPGEMLIQIYS
jgi:hypothetical protein